MKSHWSTDPIIFCVFVSWALAFVFIKKALVPVGGFTPLAFLWPRMLLSAIILFALLPIIREPVRIPRKHLMKTVVIGVVGLGTYHLLFTVALSMTTPVDTALIIGTGPVMTGLWMPLFGMARPRGRAWVGVTLCFATVAVIAVHGALENPDASGWNTTRLLGDLIMLVAANCWALNGILCRRAIPFLKPTAITAWGLLWASVLLLPFCLFGIGMPALGGLAPQDWSAVTPTQWGYFAYAVLPASSISIVFFYFGVKKVGPLHTIIYQNVSPIITAIVVFLMDDRAPSVIQVAGVFTIFLGVYLTRTSKRTADVQPIDP
ncbi:MAG TPA: DMT family transporter [Planctomycetota bacterium]|nr:DMT family transporter [Planctomycetota bacterium]